MKNPSEKPSSYSVLCKLASLPTNMVNAHTYENLAEFILHELCEIDCLPFKTAAFFIDNPDFDCFKGITGVSDTERFSQITSWDHSPHFSEHMRNAPFNQKIRSITRPSYLRADTPWQRGAQDIAQTAAFGNHFFRTFNTKHGNTGILICELRPNTCDCEDLEQLVKFGTGLLALCPVF